MEDNFNQNDFEEFLQDQVRNHRMYPSDEVWREIDKKLHGDKRWPALTIAALLLLSATVFICVYFTPKPSIFSLQPANNDVFKEQKNNSIITSITSVKPFSNGKSGLLKSIEKIPLHLPPTKTETSASNITDPTTLIANNALASLKGAKNDGHEDLKVYSVTVNKQQESSAIVMRSTASNNNSPLPDKVKSLNTTSEVTKEGSDKNMVDDFLKDHKDDIALHTQEKKLSLKNKFSYQIYAAPSTSYRKLLEDNSIEKPANAAGPVGLNYVTDVNKVVRHKPGTGIELGVNFMYNLSNKVRVKSGFQFNMRQYSIEAYRSTTELASIALLGNNGIDTINTLSIYRNNNGYSSAELVNRYFQISMPIGLEWEILGNSRIQFNVAGSIQPTYLLNRNAYLLSTNFKNYTENPDMVRQWNLNSNIEAFISFKVGDFKWQLGPQLRYQPYSTFIPQYSIKEHLMDYGIKLGVSQVIK